SRYARRAGRIAPPSLSGLPDQEVVDGTGLDDGKELVPRASRPAAHVGVAGRVVGEHFQDLADGHPADRLPGLHDGHRAKQSETVQRPIGGHLLDRGGCRHARPRYCRVARRVKGPTGVLKWLTNTLTISAPGWNH